MIDKIKEYVGAVARELKSGVATEHSYRPCLKALFEALLPGMDAVNEPSRVECGAPDMMLRARGGVQRPVGYVETKDVGDCDLDGNGVHKEQFDRYKAELSNVVFTDYLDFHFYEDGAFVARCRVGEVAGSGVEPAAPEELERFAGLVRHFAEVAPKRITSASRLAALMAGKARLLARAVAATLGGSQSSATADGTKPVPPSPLRQQFLSFREWLVHDLDAASFADVYAQTIVYGMFAARLHDATPEDFSRAEAASLVPRSNPLLRRLFRDLDEYADESIAWIVDDLVALFAASDVSAILRSYGSADRDPLLHFYEDFLAAYNPALRKQRGVWYTPAPVVRFIVRCVDAILRRDFGLSGGLADASKTRVRVVNDDRARKGDAKFVEREMHRVQILDPATGTGTFLAEAVRLIRSKFAGQEGMWPGYVRDHLVPRLNGFEILMASYAMAHLKLDLLLPEAAPERLRIFLTNSLEEFSEATGTLWAMELSNEAREADFIKRDCPVMVVMGNPPYSVSSSNKSEWIQKLVADYKKGLGEKNVSPLADDYIKFIRLGQHYIDRNGEGILAYIANNSFIDGIIHRQMRKSLMESFDEIYILDLHGNARKKETAPDGGKDENVFDIMQGVSINIFVKRGRNLNAEAQRRRDAGGPRFVAAADGTKPVPPCRVYHAEVFGEREAKYAFLDAHDIANVEYKELHPQDPYYFFVPKDFALQEEYEKGFSVNELFNIGGLGVKFRKDNLLVHHSSEEVGEMLDDINTMSACDLTRKYEFNETDDWKIAEKKPLFKIGDSANVRPVMYRIFDFRYCYYPLDNISKIIVRGDSRCNLMRNLLHENIALCMIRNSRREPILPCVANTIVGKDYISSLDNCTVFPLYLYSESMGKVEKTPNLNPEIVKRIAKVLDVNGQDARCPSAINGQDARCPSAEQIFHYIYAVLHTPAYRERYKEFLKVDFPRIPYPSSVEEFRRFASIGERLVAVHLLKDPKVCDMFSPYANFPVAGSNRVEAVRFDGRVSINATQYFDNVPAEAWEFFIGGYQPAQKWLKDRKGRVLTSDDLLHYKAIVSALVETRRLMAELDTFHRA